MTDEKDTGGPAFPVIAGQQVYCTGMTLRDYFAGQALAGICADRRWDQSGWDGMASVSYMIADALIAERNKRGG